MVFGTVARQLSRKFSTSVVARSQHWQQKGIPGSNLPVDLVTNKYKTTLYFILFFSSGISAPFYLVRHQLVKK